MKVIKWFVVLFVSPLLVWGQTDSTELVKKGWNFGFIPVVAFDSDLGFQYGGIVNLFNYGNGLRYPRYDHSVYFEISRYTKGSGINRLFYDSDKLFRNLRVTSDISYLTEQALNFYGFNGYQAQYKPEWEQQGNPGYKSRMYYRHAREILRYTIDLQRKLGTQKFLLSGGISIYDYSIRSVDISRLNNGKKAADQLPSVDSVPGLYENYVQWGIISPQEKSGGTMNYIKLGITFDTRDNEPNPMSGIWVEGVLAYNPDITWSGRFDHLKMVFIYRQYFTLVKNRINLAYRLGYQGTLLGKCPFYAQPYLTTSFLRGTLSEGLGGAKTLRGIVRNRIVGDDIIYGNLELRYKFFKTQIWSQNIYVATNFFIDAGMVTDPVVVDKSHIPANEDQTQFFTSQKEIPHFSYGAGIHIAMNQNFVIACDYGRAFKREDGESGLYIGLNFLF